MLNPKRLRGDESQTLENSLIRLNMQDSEKGHGISLSYEDLTLITNNFSEKNLLGGAGCHWKVYRGMIEEGMGFGKPLEVTVKTWDDDDPGNENLFHFKDEMALLRSKSMFVKLFGYCREDKTLALVYECASMYTLQTKLCDYEDFTWPKRAEAALQIACGLLILEKKFQFSVLCSLDPAHILLDKEFKPILFDFRMERGLICDHRRHYQICPSRCVENSGVSTTKDHVFDFGTLLLALLEMNTVPRDKILSDPEGWVPYCNPELVGEQNSYGDLLQACDVAMKCLVSPVYRPSMIKVVAYLKGLRLVKNLMWKKRGMKHSRSMYLGFPKFKHPLSLSSNDLKMYTDNLSKSNLLDNSNTLGGHSRGKVYGGRIKQGEVAQEVTVKIWDSPNKSLTYFENELMFLTLPSMSSHPGLVELIGYCKEDGMLGLVYDLAPVSTLRSKLCDDVSFGWHHRIMAAYGIASTLALLHSQNPPFIHRNLDPAHVMLDQNFNPRFFEFGLGSGGILGDRVKYHSRYYGPMGLIDPVHFGGTWNTACDVYAFGILLLSLVSCRCVIDPEVPESHITLKVEGKKMHDIVHQRFLKTDRKNAFRMTDLAFSCMTDDLDKRPSMQQVVSQLVNWNICSQDSVPK